MKSSYMLFFLFLLGVLGKNRLVYLSCAVIIVFEFLGLFPKSVSSQNIILDLGIILLVIGVLLPFVSDNSNIINLYKNLATFEGIVSFGVGVTCAILAKNGVLLMKSSPGTTVGLLLGSIVGTSFFGGIPVGPLVAAGFSAFVVNSVKKT